MKSVPTDMKGRSPPPASVQEVFDALLSSGRDALSHGDQLVALERFSAAAATMPHHLEPHLERASLLLELGRLDESARAYAAILVEYPNEHQAVMGLVRTYRLQGETAAAVDTLSVAASRAPSDDIWARLELANLLHDIGRQREAEAAYTAVLAVNPKHFGALLGLGRVARAEGEHAKSLVRFSAALAVAPSGDPWTDLEIAGALRQLGRLDEAEAGYRKVLNSHPNQQHALIGMARTARQRGDITAALDRLFIAASNAPPNDIWARLEQADLLHDIGRQREAGAAYAAVLAVNPRHLGALLGIGRVARAEGAHAKSLEYFTAALSVAPRRDPWPELERAGALRQLDRLDEAEDGFRLVLASYPNHRHALVGLAQTARQRGDTATAIERLSVAASHAPPDDIWARLELANLLHDVGRQREAQAAYDAVLGVNAKHCGALLGLGRVARADGAHAKSLEYFLSAVEVAPEGDPWPELEAAGALRQLGRLDEAETGYRKVLVRHPNHFAALGGLGRVAGSRGDLKSALVNFVAAAEGAPRGSSGPHLELAEQHRLSGDYDAARNIARGLLDHGFGTTEAWMSLGYTERSAARHNEALEAFQQAHNRNPTLVQPRVELAVTLRDLGEPDSAKLYLEQALEFAPQNEQVLLEMGELAFRAQDHEAAASFFHEVCLLRPMSLRAYLGAARSLAELGARDEALALLEDAQALCGPSSRITLLRLELQFQSGEWTSALTSARAAFTAAPQDFWLWYQRFRFEKLLSSPTTVTACLARAPQTTHEARTRVLHFRGQAAEEDWRISEAIALYEQARAARPDDAWLLIDLARARLLALEIDEALDMLKIQVLADAPNALLLGRSLKVSQTHLGQILNEFKVDADTLTRLTALRQLPPKDRIVPLRALVPELPDSTAVAMTFLVALRQAAMIPALRPGEAGRHADIPPAIMQYWDSPDPPPDVAYLMEGWRTAHPKFSHVLINDQEAQEFLAQHYVPPVLKAYQRSAELAQKADLFRLAYLFVKGGFYIDADDRCLAPLPSVIPASATMVLYQEEYGTVGNNFIAAVPRHPVIGAALMQLVTAVNRGDRDILWFASGPGLLTRAVAQHLARGPNPVEDELRSLRILARREIHGAVAMHCKVTYKQTDRHWSNTSFRRARRPPQGGTAPS